MNDKELNFKAICALIALNGTAEPWKRKPTEEEKRLFWDDVVKHGNIPTYLSEEDRSAFDEALERLGDDQTPAFESFDQLLAEQLDLEDAMEIEDYLDE